MPIKRTLGALVAGGLLTIGGLASADETKADTRVVEKNEVTAKNDDSKYQHIEKRIEARLERDKGLKDHRIDVDIHDGKVVLKGEVDTVAERKRAGRIATRSGAKLLDNQLTVDGDRDGAGIFGTERKASAVTGGAVNVDRAEDRAEKAKDRIEDTADRSKDNIDKKATADKELVDKNADRAKARVDRNLEGVKNEAKKEDRPLDGK